MIQISPSLTIPDDEVVLSFIHASGPGGQNVNKVASAVQLRFDVDRSPSLSLDVKTRLKKLAGKRLTGEGYLVIEAKRYRSQERNKVDALSRFERLVTKSLAEPDKRKATRPPRASIQKRLTGKKRRAALKKNRNKVTSQAE